MCVSLMDDPHWGRLDRGSTPSGYSKLAVLQTGRPGCRLFGPAGYQANFDQSTLRISPDERNSVWKARAALRVWGVWPPRVLNLR